VVLGEADKPIVAEFAKAALAKQRRSRRPSSGLVAQYYAIQDQQRAKRKRPPTPRSSRVRRRAATAWKGAEYRRT
jgi:hypothetical protein